jgi:endonuclease I
MSDKYKMYLTDEMRATFMQWSAQDPVDDKERWRNRRIKEIQGDSNPYIEP